MKIKDMIPMLQTGRWQAIVKNVAGRRMFLGIERISKRSRKNRVKYMCPPQDLDRLLAEHAKKPGAAEPAPSAPETPNSAPTAQPDSPSNET